jgi:hypothetical protein
LRLAANSTGYPSETIWSRWRDSCQLCSAVLAKPSPGSMMILSGATPAASASSTRWDNSWRTSATTSRYTARRCMSRECPRQCMSTHGQPASATTFAIVGSASPPETSLTTAAPASSAAAATLARVVSMLIGTPAAASARITGTTRPISVSASIRSAPGRVDSPPTSTRSAPCARSSTPCATAASRSAYRPPSEKESGVTLSTPITTGLTGSAYGAGDRPRRPRRPPAPSAPAARPAPRPAPGPAARPRPGRPPGGTIEQVPCSMVENSACPAPIHPGRSLPGGPAAATRIGFPASDLHHSAPRGTPVTLYVACSMGDHNVRSAIIPTVASRRSVIGRYQWVLGEGNT